ncbi:hypothetical protein P692DRAFT_20860697 [Suillus brevipes Sb2]|nr:hypothetical protein P692DRAFT_20860697 [Suillus brevipes Sb2]
MDRAVDEVVSLNCFSELYDGAADLAQTMTVAERGLKELTSGPSIFQSDLPAMRGINIDSAKMPLGVLVHSALQSVSAGTISRRNVLGSAPLSRMLNLVVAPAQQYWLNRLQTLPSPVTDWNARRKSVPSLDLQGPLYVTISSSHVKSSGCSFVDCRMELSSLNQELEVIKQIPYVRVHGFTKSMLIKSTTTQHGIYFVGVLVTTALPPRKAWHQATLRRPRCITSC